MIYYKTIYKEIICNEEEIIKRAKQMHNANIHIHTDYVTGNTKKRENEEVIRFFEKHRRKAIR